MDRGAAAVIGYLNNVASRRWRRRSLLVGQRYIEQLRDMRYSTTELVLALKVLSPFTREDIE
jgi:hypothetical protein